MEKEKEGPESGQINDVDRTRRRLLKLALWVPPAILTLSSRTAWAQNTIKASQVEMGSFGSKVVA